MEIIVRNVNKQQWSGLYKYRNCATYLGSYYTRSGRLYTGLNDEEAEELGKKLNFDLTSGSKFWETFFIRLDTNDLILRTEDAFDRLRYLFLKSHKRVAASMADNKPGADYILINKETEANEVNKKNKQKRDAIKEFDKMSVNEMRKCLRLYGISSENTSNEVTEQTLYGLVEKDPTKFFEKWVNNDNKTTEFLISDAISKNIMRKNKNVYKYGTDIIGNNLDDAVSYLDNPINNDLRKAIMKEADAKN
jgi:hypothetical protein